MAMRPPGRSTRAASAMKSSGCGRWCSTSSMTNAPTDSSENDIAHPSQTISIQLVEITSVEIKYVLKKPARLPTQPLAFYFQWHSATVQRIRDKPIAAQDGQPKYLDGVE